MKCVTCTRGQMKPSPVEIRREVGEHVFIATVPGYRCDTCGEVQFEGADNTPRFRHLLDEAEARIVRGEGMEHEDFWRAVEQAAPARSAVKAKRSK